MNYPFYQQPYSQFQQQMYMSGRPTYMDNLSQNFQGYSIKGRPVTSYDEAKASMIDFDGTVFYFPDLTNRKIYTKQINLDGTSSLKTYILTPDSMEQEIPILVPNTNTSNELPIDTSITREEFELSIKNLMNELQEMKGALSKNEPTRNVNPADIKF